MTDNHLLTQKPYDPGDDSAVCSCSTSDPVDRTQFRLAGRIGRPLHLSRAKTMHRPSRCACVIRQNVADQPKPCFNGGRRPSRNSIKVRAARTPGRPQAPRSCWPRHRSGLGRLIRLAAAWVICLTLGAVGVQAGQAEQLPRMIRKTMRHDGVTRVYHVRLPNGFDRAVPAPVVIALHGGGGTGRRFDRVTAGTLTAAADRKGVVLVFPEGVNRQWCDGRVEHLKTSRSYDDVGFIARIIDTVAQEYGIDSTRVYVTGISNGGFMAVRLAMDLPQKIAAVAPVAAQIPVVLQDRKPARPISVMIVNGTNDPIVPFNGGHVRLFRFGHSRGRVLSTAATVEWFRRHNACTPTPIRTRLEDKDPTDGATVEVETYGEGMEGTEVVLVKVIGGGHTWPGGWQYLPQRLVGGVCRDISASEMILDLFLRHARKRIPVAKPR